LGGQPVADRIDTTRVVAAGFSEMEFQQSRGAGFIADQTDVVPSQERPGRIRDTAPDGLTHTVTGATAVRALATGADPPLTTMMRGTRTQLAITPARFVHLCPMRSSPFELTRTVDLAG